VSDHTEKACDVNHGHWH